ncbi:MAG: nucleotide exchange factor GrpE [Lachnospiraceae bacterium]|nr:nucleotide exchange factor GrpE [Lachnospiraceae bacterium]
MFFTKQHSALLSRLEEKIQTLEQGIAAQKMQLDTQLGDISQNIVKLQTSVHKQDMAVEDLLEEWNDKQSDAEHIKRQFREYEQNEHRLLELFEAYQEQLWNLKRFAEEKDESLAAQLSLMEKKLEHYRQLCGISMIGECGTEVDYDLYEVLEAVDTEDEGKDRTVVCVYRCGYLYKGKVIKKAQAAVYRYRAK